LTQDNLHVGLKFKDICHYCDGKGAHSFGTCGRSRCKFCGGVGRLVCLKCEDVKSPNILALRNRSIFVKYLNATIKINNTINFDKCAINVKKLLKQSNFNLCSAFNEFTLTHGDCVYIFKRKRMRQFVVIRRTNVRH
jgi:hypothetical protein